MDLPAQPEYGRTPIDELDAWAQVVGTHPIWERTAQDDPDREALRKHTVTLAERLSEVRWGAAGALADDPWQDFGFATRMIRSLGSLLERMPGQITLAPAEVGLLLTVPLLYDTLWSSLVARERGVGPHDLAPSPDATSDRAAFERFALSYPRAYRRGVAAARSGRLGAAGDVGWWLLHRWIARRPHAYRPSTIIHLLGPIADGPPAAIDDVTVATPPTASVLAPVRLAELVRALRADPGFLGRADRPDALVPLAKADGVRERMVGYLLTVARALAVETPALPEVIGEHLAIADPVSPADLRGTVTVARWRRRGAGLVLAAECGHPAVEVALRTHVDVLKQLLAAVQRSTVSDEVLAPLRHLPTHVTTDGLGPAEVAGSPAYQSAGIRFRLAEDRVQELLMGEQLYGDPALAIRELYQNALDACRYRQARAEYLRRAHGVASDWVGRIRFEQGLDEDNRPYLDCVDNGIGMGVHELSEVFAQAGVRLADLPEFLEEQVEWGRLDPPVQLFPNSRFGIGVLSYFMLADEITVETCRLGRDGRPGERLRVSIAGPGSLFRIRPLGPGTDAGTTVRLHLHHDSAVSCVELLRRVLWVADFQTEAVDGAERQTWRPGELSDAAGYRQDSECPDCTAGGRSGGPAGGRSGARDHHLVAAEGGDVWWCRGDGAILADGLAAGQDLTGAIVNLSRELAPRLSVDRTRILAYRQEDVDRLLWAAVPALTAAGPAVLNLEWLYSLCQARPLIADVVFEQALASGYRQWEMDGETVDAALAGCFAPDSGSMSGPYELMEWRLTALAAAGRYRKIVKPGADWGQVVRARPSDALILSVDADGRGPWLDPVGIVPLIHLVRAGRRIGRSPSEVADRLETLGYRVAVGHERIGIDPDDLVFTSRDLDGSHPWLAVSEPVPLLHLLRAAYATGRGLADVADRLRGLGFGVDHEVHALPVDRLEPDDPIITSRDLDGSHPWLPPAEPVPLLHVLRAAHRVDREASEVAARLAALGYPLADGCEALRTEPDDLVLVSRDLDGSAPWLDPAEPVPPVHLLRAAGRTGRSVPGVTARLALFGFALAGRPERIRGVRLEPEDLVLLSRDLDGASPWLDASRPVPLIHLLRAAEESGRRIADLVPRFVQCGYRVEVDLQGVLVDHLEPDDLVLTSVDLDGSGPWLDPEKPVPAVHLARAVQRTRRELHDIAARLTVLGYHLSLEYGRVPVDRLAPDDLLITSRDLDGAEPWLDLEERVPLPHLLQAARRTRRPVRDVAGRLTELGYHVQVNLDAIAIETIKSSDLVLASVDLDGSQPWLDPAEPVPFGHLVTAAKRLRRRITEVADRLTALGYRVPDPDVRLPRLRPGGA